MIYSEVENIANQRHINSTRHRALSRVLVAVFLTAFATGAGVWSSIASGHFVIRD